MPTVTRVTCHTQIMLHIY